tara:strand:+ start:270 stop:512 length:243 start_codon:yes stop_codon:yes gene_type:complete
MSRKIVNNDLKKLIKKIYGSQLNCSIRLGVTPQTVHNWHDKNPRGMLKFAPEIVCQCDITWTQLAGEVLMRENEIDLLNN